MESAHKKKRTLLIHEKNDEQGSTPSNISQRARPSGLLTPKNIRNTPMSPLVALTEGRQVRFQRFLNSRSTLVHVFDDVCIQELVPKKKQKRNGLKSPRLSCSQTFAFMPTP